MGFVPYQYAHMAAGFFSGVFGICALSCSLSNLDAGPAYVRENRKPFTHVVYISLHLGILVFFLLGAADLILAINTPS